jgi:hypothetical protein
MEIKHVIFNPMTTTLFVGPLDSILKREESEGWTLDKIISHHQYESVAVFSRNIEVVVEEEKEMDAGEQLVDAIWKIIDNTGSLAWVDEYVENAKKGWKAAQRSMKKTPATTGGDLADSMEWPANPKKGDPLSNNMDWRCSCGDYSYNSYRGGACGPNGCYNRPA